MTGGGGGGRGGGGVRETYIPESEVVPFPPLDEEDESRGLGSLACGSACQQLAQLS